MNDLHIKRFLILLLSFSASYASAGWTTCYNQKSKRLYFSPYNEIKAQYQAPKSCSGPVYYQAQEGEQFIADEFSDKGFPKGLPGTPKVVNVSSKQKLLISQWNSFGKINNIKVFQPDFKNKRVQLVCDVPNWGEAYSFRIEGQTKKLSIIVRVPIDDDQKKFSRKMVKCSN